MQLTQYLNLKKKARIIVPDSCVLIGVVDDRGILEENEVFIQVRKDNFSQKANQIKGKWSYYEDDEASVLEGKLIVTRNPCTHPGDIRILQGVFREELSHLFNIVVFSSKGDRPQCNKMAGGDLDGDVYFVCWEKSLVDSLDPEMLEPPATYSKPTLVNEKPESDTLPDHFIFYLERDVLGKLANLHLALCDQIGRDGPKHPEC